MAAITGGWKNLEDEGEESLSPYPWSRYVIGKNKISEFGGGTGWTLYPPLSTSFMSLSDGRECLHDFMI